MPSLYEIGADLRQIEELLDGLDGETTGIETALTAWFSEVDKNLENKVDRYVSLIRNLEKMAEDRRAEAKRMAELARADEAKAERLERRLGEFFVAQGISEVKTPRFTLAMRQAGGKPAVELLVPAGEVPIEAMRVRCEPDLENIRERIERKEDVPYARLKERGMTLRIR